MKRLLTLLLLTCWSPSAAAWPTYRYGVLVNIDDEKLVLIDAYGERYVVEATTYCFSWSGFDNGDIVISTENLDACAMATLISPSGETCDVWCP